MNIKKISGANVRNLRESKGMSQKDFADMIETSASHLSQMESGKRGIGEDILSRMVTKCKVSPDYFFVDPETRPTVDHEFISIPQVSGHISAGGGLLPDNTVEMRLAFRKDWIERKGDPSKMSLIRVIGDSMEPTLLSGDIVLVDHSRNYVDPNGGIYAISLDHDLMIKRIQQVWPSKLVRIISDNQRYNPFEVHPDQISINGKLVWYGRELER